MDKDNLEKKFQSQFSFDELETEDWNVPSDKVWNNIETNLQKKKRRVFFWWFPTLAFSAALFLVFIYVENENKKSRISVEKVTTKNNFTNSSVETKTQNSNSEAAINSINPNISEKNQGDKIKSNDNKASFLSKNKAKIVNTAVFSSENDVKSLFEGKDKNPSVLTYKDTELEKGLSIVPNNSTVILAEEKTAREIRSEENIALIPSLSIREINFLKNIQPESAYPKLRKPISKSKFAVSLAANTFFIQDKVKGNFVKSGGESFDYAYTIGASVIKPFKRVFFEAGIGFSQMNYKLKYDLVLPFNGVGETKSTDGNFDNTYNGSVPTSLGDLKMEMVLARISSQTVQQGEQIPISANGTERLTFLQVPLSLGKNFAIAPKLSFTGKATLNNLLRVATRTSFDQVISHHDNVHETNTSVKTSPTPNAWCPFLGGSVEINYKLNSKWTISANTFAQQSLLPIFKNDKYSNTPYLLGFGTDLKYAF